MYMRSDCINPYCTYITSNPGRTAFYTGVTNNLKRRMSEHLQNRGNRKTFAGRYFCYEPVYYECYPYLTAAIWREKEIKLFKRDRKVALIKSKNPGKMKLIP